MTLKIAAQRPYLDDAHLSRLMDILRYLEKYGAKIEDLAAYSSGPLIAASPLNVELFDAINEGTRLGFVRVMGADEKKYERLLIGKTISVSPERIRTFNACVNSSTPPWFNKIERSCPEQTMQYVSTQEGGEPFTPLTYYVTGVAQDVHLVGTGDALYYPIVAADEAIIESAALFFTGGMTGIVLPQL